MKNNNTFLVFVFILLTIIIYFVTIICYVTIIRYVTNYDYRPLIVSEINKINHLIDKGDK